MRIGIVHSSTSEKFAYSSDQYARLFMEAQNQALQAGIPFDILTEADLTDLSIVKQYNALVFPSFVAAPASQIEAIYASLKIASEDYHIGMIAQGPFLTHDDANGAVSLDRMKSIFGIEPAASSLAAEHFSVVAEGGSAIMRGYTQGESLGQYNYAYQTYAPVGVASQTLASLDVNGQRLPSVIATETGGRNVHFSSDVVFGDNNILASALKWSVLGDAGGMTLALSRQAGLMAVRIDMDQAMFSASISPVDADGNPMPGLYDKMVPIVEQWHKDFGFVGTFFIDIGNNPPTLTTNWAKSGLYYDRLIALGNEIGTHSVTHPAYVDLLTPEEIKFEFNGSKSIIESNLGISVHGAAVPGGSETYSTSREMGQYFDYVTGGTVQIGGGYLGSIGHISPDDQNFVYIAPNMSSDFSQIVFSKNTIPQAEAFWSQQWSNITKHAAMPIAVWGIHDYGIGELPGDDGSPTPYDTQVYTNVFSRAHDANTEFVTLAELGDRVEALHRAHVETSRVGNVITASIAPDGGASDLGTFALNLAAGGPEVIRSVDHWYAYDTDSVFIAQTGGKYTVSLGAAQDNVTHITRLPSRANLLEVSGDGVALGFAFDGSGVVAIDLGEMTTNRIAVVGALDSVFQGGTLNLNISEPGVHRVSLSDGGLLKRGEVGTIHYLNGSGQEYAQLYQLADASGWVDFDDIGGTESWSHFRTYFNTENKQTAQTVSLRDGTSWTEFVSDSPADAWAHFASYFDANRMQVAQTVSLNDGTGWTAMWNTSQEGAWHEFDTFVDGQGHLAKTVTQNKDGSRISYYVDLDNQHEWATSTEVRNANGEVVAFYGTGDDGTTWILM